MFFFARPTRSPRAFGPPRQLRIPPVDPFKHVGHLGCRDPSNLFCLSFDGKLSLYQLERTTDKYILSPLSIRNDIALPQRDRSYA
jgi:hypothetical protein